MKPTEIKQELDRITEELKKPGALVFALLKQRERLLQKLDEMTVINFFNRTNTEQ